MTISNSAIAKIKTSSSPFQLAGEVALITGGGTGLGLAIAHGFVASGAKVVLAGRREAELQKAVTELGENAHYVCHDVTNYAAAGELVAAATQKAGAPPSILVNNAGIHLKKPAVDTTPSLLALCGAPALKNIHGKSWVKLVQRGDLSWRKSFLYHYNYEKQFPYTPNVRSVRTETWKYTRSPHGDGGPDRHPAELYNIEFDPEDRHNLAANPKYAGEMKEMQAELLKVMKQVGLTPENDKMPLDEGIKSELPEQKIR